MVNQGQLGIAFFEATAFIVLLVLFLIFQRDHINRYFRLWVAGWLVFTLTALCEVVMLSRNMPTLWLEVVLGEVTAMLLFAGAVMRFTAGTGNAVGRFCHSRASCYSARITFSEGPCLRMGT